MASSQGISNAQPKSPRKLARQKLGWDQVAADTSCAISRSEFIAAYGRDSAAEFDRADSSKDGMLSKQEYTEMKLSWAAVETSEATQVDQLAVW